MSDVSKRHLLLTAVAFLFMLLLPALFESAYAPDWIACSLLVIAAGFWLWRRMVRGASAAGLPVLLSSAAAGALIGVSGGCRLSAAGVLVFPGLTLLIMTLWRCRRWQDALLCGYCCGLFWFMTGISWLPVAFAYFTGRSAGTGILLALPFIAIMGLKYGTFALAVHFARRRRVEFLGLLPAAAFVISEQTFSALIPTPVAVGLIPYKQLLQPADLAGDAGLGFLVVWLCFLLASSISTKRNPPGASSHFHPALNLRAATPVLLFLAAWFSYGQWRLSTISFQLRHASTFSIGIAQANTHSEEGKLSTDESRELARTIVQMAARMASANPLPQLLVYGESTAPVGFRSGHFSLFRDAYTVAARESGIPVIFDNLAVEQQGGKMTLWREALLLEPDGSIASAYRKRQLIPVGETLPGETLWPGLREFFHRGRSFSAGTSPTVMDIRGTKAAPILCFEILNPRLVRQSADLDAKLIINPANDAWFNSPKEARQHYWGAAFRAVENRLPLVRVANTGVSAVVESSGKVAVESPLNQQWIATHNVLLAEICSPYRSGGFLFPWLCAATCLLVPAWVFTRRRREAL